MTESKYEVEFYRKPNGRCPTEEFLDGVNKKTDLPYIQNALEQLEEHGPRLEGKLVKYLAEGIYELRRETISGQFRLFYFFFDGNKIVITHGFHKKAKNKDVYQPEIKRALDYKKDYFEQHK